MSLQDLKLKKASSSVSTILPTEETIPTEETVAAEQQIEKGWYKADRLKRYARASGVLVLPVNGYYIPECEEDEQLLSYYESQNMSYVTKVV